MEPGGGGRSFSFPEISFSSCLRHTHAVLRSIRSCLRRSPRTGQAAVCGKEPLVVGSAGSLACLPRGRVDQMGPGLDVGGVAPPTPSSLCVQPRATHPSALSAGDGSDVPEFCAEEVRCRLQCLRRRAAVSWLIYFLISPISCLIPLSGGFHTNNSQSRVPSTPLRREGGLSLTQELNITPERRKNSNLFSSHVFLNL